MCVGEGVVQDGGGLTVDNKLPLTEPIHVQSEGELRREIENIRKRLGSTMDWVERIQALIKLEGLVRGGANQWGSLVDGLKQLKDPLVAQVGNLSGVWG